MGKRGDVKLVIVGSIGLDTIETPSERREEILGGSVSYACAAASFLSPVGMVGIVGSDFPKRHIELYRKFGIDLRGLECVEGKTFRWSGVYDSDMNSRRTISTHLNVFQTFMPKLPDAYRRAPFLFLGNIAPGLQLHVLSQVKKPRFVGADTMDLWIHTAREPLMQVIRKVDMLTLNESEARQLTAQHNLVNAARRILQWGPKYVIVKKGEHGAMLFSRSGIFVIPAFPLEEVKDPTGAGDTFAGGMMGALAKGGAVSDASVRSAMAWGSVIASFGVESFSLDGLRRLNRPGIGRRMAEFKRMIRL